MPSRRELPRAMDVDHSDDELSETGPTYVFVGHSDCRAVNEWEALMTSPPHTHPDVSRAERLVLRDVIADAIEGLSDEEQWIFDALFVRRASLRELAREIAVPKTTLARRRDALLVTLRTVLEVHPAIEEYLDA